MTHHVQIVANPFDHNHEITNSSRIRKYIKACFLTHLQWKILYLAVAVFLAHKNEWKGPNSAGLLDKLQKLEHKKWTSQS